MAPALLAPPPAATSQVLPRMSVVTAPSLGTFVEAWAALDRRSYTNDSGAVCAMQLKYALAAVSNVLRFDEQAPVLSASPLMTADIVQKQRDAASKNCDDVFTVADEVMRREPQTSKEKYPMMGILRSLMLVKSMADRGRTEPAQSLFAKVEGRIIAQLDKTVATLNS